MEVGLGKQHDLNKAYNNMLKRAKGELIVIYQDYIKIEDDGLEKFWEAYKRYPDTLFTAPVGKTDKEDYTGNPQWDWRKDAIGETNWLNWEIDWGAAPLSALQKVGGFDEELDNYWSFDNVNLACRADITGYKFRCVDNPSVAYDHDAFIEHPFRDDYNPMFHNARLDDFRQGLKIDYLH